MTAPTGPLVWGQTNAYNARDDRAVITALSNNAVGIVKAPTFAAGTGLTVNIGPFTAIVSCGDGTSIVANSTLTQTVTLAGGPGAGARTDIIWLDIDPDNTGVWTINVLTQAQTVGRLGIKLGQVLVPQGANLASQATLTPSAVSWFPFAQPLIPVNVSLLRTTAINVNHEFNTNVGSAANGWQSENVGGVSAALWSASGFIAPAVGTYQLSGRAFWAQNGMGMRAGTFTKNGALLAASETRNASVSSSYSGTLIPAYPVKCGAGDVLSMVVYQNSGASLPMLQAQMSVSQQA